MTGLVEKIDKWTPSTLLKINIGIASFILIAHIGGALALISESKEPKPSLISLLHLDDYVAFFLFLSALIAMLKKNIAWSVLRLHTVILSLLALDWLYWGATLVIGEIPKGNFVWNPVLFAFLCAYPAYLLRRTYLANKIYNYWGLNYLHIIIAVSSLVISGLIIYKVMQNNV